jgi:hypothetical protein
MTLTTAVFFPGDSTLYTGFWRRIAPSVENAAGEAVSPDLFAIDPCREVLKPIDKNCL